MTTDKETDEVMISKEDYLISLNKHHDKSEDTLMYMTQ